jgi:hypothetical protein
MSGETRREEEEGGKGKKTQDPQEGEREKPKPQVERGKGYLPDMATCPTNWLDGASQPRD